MTEPPLSVRQIDRALTAAGSRFEMETKLVRGRLMRTWKNAPRDLRSVLERSRRRGEDLFLVYEDERYTYEEHYRCVASLASSLVERYGVRRGDRVAIAMRNYPEWSVAFFAAVTIGAVVVPLNAWWTAPELAYGLRDSGSSVLFVDDQRWERVKDAIFELGLADSTVAVRAPDTGLQSFDELIASSSPSLPPSDIDPDDDATIFYTSGTTGSPKGALGTHRNLCTNLLSLSYSAARTFKASPPTSQVAERSKTVYLLSVPLFHATGCHSILLPTLASGGTLVMMYKWDAARALELIERERVTTFGGVPTMVWEVLSSPFLAERDISSVKTVGYGGAPAPPELVARIAEMFPGRTPSNGYGLTETSSVTSVNAGPLYQARPDSVGVPVPVVDVKIVDDHGLEVATGEVGELLVYGPNIVKGYWQRREDSAATFIEGWLHTGDLAKVDDDGYVYVVDRAKDMIIRGGENVYCAEVEAALFEHPEVVDTGVFGVPHLELGEEVGAVVRLQHAGAVDENQLRAHLAERIAAFKIPTHLWFVDTELPRSPAGKLLKRELRQSFLAGGQTASQSAAPRGDG